MAASAESVPTPYSVLLVEDDRHARELAHLLFERDPDLEIVGEAVSADEALSFLDEGGVDVVILDHQLEGDVTGRDFAVTVKERSPSTRVVLFTGFTDVGPVGTSVDAMIPKLHGELLVPTVRELLDLPPA